VLIESKWGPLDIYWHTPHDQVYSQRFEYRRSARSGHDLTIVERGPAPAPVAAGAGVRPVDEGASVPGRP
jgi:hypothetical protein